MTAIRLATDEEGPVLGRLVAGDFPWMKSLDWSRVYPGWLVALNGERIVGAVQMLRGWPAGSLEFLSTDGDLGLIARGRVARKLLLCGMHMLKTDGAKIAFGHIPYTLEDYERALVKRNGTMLSAGTLMAANLERF